MNGLRDREEILKYIGSNLKELESIDQRLYYRDKVLKELGAKGKR